MRLLPTMRVLPLCLAAVLLASCSDDGPGATAAPTSAPTASAPTASATTTAAPEPYVGIAPPTARAVGDFPEVVVNRALQHARGLVAFQLFEDSSLKGTDKQELVKALTGITGDPSIARDLGGARTARGLDYRPLFAPNVTVKASAAKVERSVWTTEAVQGRAGERGLRVSWSGAVRYPTTVDGRAQDVAFALNIAYVFAPLENEPSGIQLAQVVRGSSHAAPVLAACLAKGVLLPIEGTPTSADLGPGPWPPAGGSGASCPL